MSTSRRMFLRGAGGISVSIPCLTSLLSRQARAAYTPPKRFVAISADLGVHESAWYPAGYKRPLPAGQSYTSRDLAAIDGSISDIIHKPFDRLKSKLLLLRGLDSALHFPNSNGHMRSTTLCGTFLNMQQPGSSIDIVLSRSPKVRLPSTSVAHVSCGIRGENHSFLVDKGIMKAPFMYLDGKQLFDYLFGAFAAPTTDEAAKIVGRKTSLIDAVTEHYHSVMTSPRLGTADRRVLDEFVTSFASVEQRLKTQKPIAGCQVKTPAFAPYNKDDVFQYERRIGEMLDTLALALKCGIVQVAQFGLPTPEDSRTPPASNYAVFNNLNAPGVSFTAPAHAYSHGEGNANQTNPIYQRWLAGFAAYFMSALDVQESAESPATYLDNSLVLFHNNLSNGALHLRYDLPALAAGSLGGVFTTGKFIDYTQNLPHTVQNNAGKSVGVDYNRWLVTMLQGFGLSEADYQQPGQPPGFGSDVRHGSCHAALDTSKRREPLPGLLTR